MCVGDDMVFVGLYRSNHGETCLRSAETALCGVDVLTEVVQLYRSDAGAKTSVTDAGDKQRVQMNTSLRV